MTIESLAKPCSDTQFLEKMLKISIERKIDLNATDQDGGTPFHLMCMTRCSTLSTAIYFIHFQTGD